MKNLFLAISVFLATLSYGQDANVKKLIKLAEKGDVQAQTELADAYFKGKGVRRSYQEAVVWLEKVAETGDLNAQYQLAQCYFNGKGVPKSPQKGVEWLTKVADAGNPEAQRELALCYRDGKGVEQSKEKYYALIEKHAEKEKPEVQLDLAKAYHSGEGVTKDVNKAKYWAEQASKNGNSEAELLLASWTYEVNASNPEAIKRLTQVANKGNTEAQRMLADAYLEGKGVEKSEAKAIEMLEKAAKGGDAEAMYQLGNFYFYGNSPLIGKYYKKAINYYTQAANKGNAAAQAQLALCFYNGIGTNASPKDAFSWILKSVNTNPTPKAQNNLGVCYAVGIGAQPSNAQALEFFQKAAEAGDVTAQYNLGNMLLQEGQLDVKKGFDYLEKAAAANHLLALKKLGDLYFNGKYTNQSFERAFEYYTKASKQTPTPQKEMLDYFYQGQEEAYADVLYNLSQCYAEGKGVKKSMREASKWAVKAAGLSNKYAFDWLNKIVEKNDPKESPEVILAVADGYFYAKGTSKQNDKAFPLYEKLAKQQDNTTAQKRLMEYYFEVKNPDKNDEKAVYWAERVAKKGDASTQFSLGKYYMTMVPDVKPQPATPAPKPTPKQTTKKPTATTTPTVAVTSSRSIEPNSPEAEARAELLRRQRGGKSISSAKQQYAVRASTRPAVAQNAPKTPMKHLNETKGIHWLAKAAEQNNVEALNELGSYYFEKQNFGQALANFQKSAQRDYAQGQYNLANCYYNGNGIDRSYEKAANYYKLSARKDYAPAQFRLGHCYYHGEGIEQSDSRAADWFEQACDNGEKKACDMLKVVTAKK